MEKEFEGYKYIIFQIENSEESRGRIFFGLPEGQEIVDFKTDNYKKVYEGNVYVNKENALDEIFVVLNTNHPVDYKGRSLSVSDIVKIDGKYYHCESFGWKEIQPINYIEIEE